MIVATAGHVDHGKTSLVRALTGVDTDRLPEEKKRGMTIDLGFAYAGPLGFVDVPGHERFVHNMLAGVGGVDFVLFVVAADDGPMPQTREHLAILDLLGVARGAVALTKIDRVGPERVAEVRTQIDALLAPTLLAGMPVFPVSSITSHGIDVLKLHLTQQQTKTALRSTEGHFRLSVDRAFTIAGAGLVVTGTALSGEVAVGDEARALIAGKTARVRGIHAQNAPAQRGRAGERLALNLAGLDAGALARGDWIVRGEVPPPAWRFDARLRVTDPKPLAHWTPVHVHLGAADVLGRVALLDNTGLVQIVLERPIGALRGDRFIVRDQSARRTLGGGMVIDVFPPPRGRARPERLAWLRTMETGNDREALERLLRENPLGIDLSRFLANRNLKTLPEVPMRAAGGIGFSPEHWKALRRADVADHLLLADLLPHAHSAREAGEVAVVGDVAVGVADLDQVAEATRPAAVDHRPVGHRPDRGPLGRCVVDAVVRAPDAQDRVQARVREGGRDPAVAHRGHQEVPLHGAPVGPVV
ncbi:MAG TPA: selenocysteine-specific translation elongation factor, partial [Burkholderiales bacterium]|nr:selenocysteine-specific translation elongation factor [Burkholderiales bacterium]